MNLIFALRLGGMVHLSILVASGLAPRVLHWKTELAMLSLFSRQVVWVHGAFLVLTILGFGVISLTNAPALAGGTALARSFCALVAVFWLARLSLQFYFDAKPALTTTFFRIGYRLLPVLFGYLAVAYGWAALTP